MADKPFEMEYRLLGETGLKISVLGLGAMTYDTVDQTLELLRCVRDFGVNFFDNAEVYGVVKMGMAETNFGKALKILENEDSTLWRRTDLVITTKLFMGPQKGIAYPKNIDEVGQNEYGLTRKHIYEGMKDSLKRLQLEYVDIVYAHRPDNLTAIEAIVESFNFLINKGYAFHWGTSMWKPLQIAHAYWYAKMQGLIGPCIEQPKYSMFDRSVMEYRYLDLFKKPYYLGTTIWNVLDSGVLSGKYNKSNDIPKDGRLSGNNKIGAFLGNLDYVTKTKVEKVDKLMVIAKKLNISMAQLAIGWLIKNKNVTCCLLGATKAYQLEDSMGAIKAANLLTKDIIDQIEKILDNKPQAQEIDREMRNVKQIISRL